MPPDLFTRDLEVSVSSGVIAPRLWVRRLAVWREPGSEPIRDVQLRPGLNIVWSPDDEDMGHGSGKTLFCRLLRFCLGEDRFAPEGQRMAIGVAFPNGNVGAEVILDGVCWAIVRSLGVRRRHVAVANGVLDEIAAGEGPSTGLDPFIDAVERAILTEDVAALIPGLRPKQRRWAVAMAWLTRDQECRFDHVLDWRSSTSDSDSPARGLNRTETLDALRAFLQAITPEEVAKRAELDGLAKEHVTLEQEVGHRSWEIEGRRRRLITALGVGGGWADGELLIEALRQAARTRMAEAAKIPEEVSSKDIEAARETYEAARSKVGQIEKRIERLEGEMPLIESLIKRIDEEYPTLKYRADEADKPLCPICEVEIDIDRAIKCGLSDKLPDAESIRKRLSENREAYASETERLASTRRQLDQAKPERAAAQQMAERLGRQLRKLEAARDGREDVWYSARRLVDKVSHLEDLIARQEASQKRLRNVEKTIEAERERVGGFRDKQAQVFGKLAEKFDAIIRFLVGDKAEGRVSLFGNDRIDLNVRIGGDRSTAAIESLKILAFDLAALCRSMEGATRVPAFLVHDSPREADLGLPIYHRLFELARGLEGFGPAPLFQYIVTTTTKPSETFQAEPWLRLTIRGAPPEERLLRVDL